MKKNRTVLLRKAVASFTIGVMLAMFVVPQIALAAYQSSDVLGQLDFTTGTANTMTLGSPNSFGLDSPFNTTLDQVNHRLFISDTANNRVLVFSLDTDNTPLDYQADFVLGQLDFTGNGGATTQNGLFNPYGLAYASASERLFVAESVSNRVVVFDVATITNGEDAVNVLGQSNFTSDTGAVGQDRLSAPVDVAYDAVGNRLFVADTSNNRVVVFDVATITDGELAVGVLGQDNFTSNTGETTQDGLSLPTGVTYDVDGRRLFVADTSNNRAITYDLSDGVTNGEDAANVLGQNDFTSDDSLLYDWTEVLDTAPNGIAAFTADTTNEILYSGSTGDSIIRRCDTTTDCDDAGDWTTSFDTTAVTVASLLFDAVSGVLYAGTGSAGIIYRCDTTTPGSCDDASDWTVSYDSVTNTVFSLAHDAANGIIYAGTSGGAGTAGIIYRCETTTGCDGAGDWTLSLDSPEDSVFSLAIDSDNDVVYAGTGNTTGNIYRCDFTATACDATVDWTVVYDPPGLSGSQTFALAFDAVSGTLYAGVNNGDIYRCDTITACDASGDWTASYVSPATAIRALTIDTDAGVIYASYYTAGPGGAYRCDLTTDCDADADWTTSYDADVLFISIFYDSSTSAVYGGASSIGTGIYRCDTTTGCGERLGLDNPAGATYDPNADRLFIADSVNNRVLVWDVDTIVDGEDPVNVLGQTDFASNGATTTQSGLNTPRGLAYDTDNNRVYVVDRDNNRVMAFDADPAVLIANNPLTDGPNAVDVIGQVDANGNPAFDQNSPDNQDNSVVSVVSAQGMNEPRDTELDTTNHRLFVLDSENYRILVFELDTDNELVDHTADFVIGQPDFGTATASTSQAGIVIHASDLAYDAVDNRLFVTDGDNNRVLVWDVTSITNGEDAINVLGQLDFISSAPATTQTGMSGPNGVAYDTVNKRLFVGENGNSRITVFNLSGGIVNGMPASNVIGQPNFLTADCVTTRDGLCEVLDVDYDAGTETLFAADIQNSRVLSYDLSGGVSDGMDAANVLGQSNFVTSVQDTTQDTFNNPAGVSYDAELGRLYVSDTTNRVVVFNLSDGTANGEPAEAVIGQDDFTTDGEGTSQDELSDPWGSAFDASNRRLYVADTANSRVMIFDLVRITDDTMATGFVGEGYDETIQYEDAQGSVTFSLISGTLPPGLSIDEDRIVGMPTTIGTFGFTVRAEDDNGSYGIFVDEEELSITIEAVAESEFSSTPDITPYPFGVDGEVYSLAKGDGVLYAGGGFSQAGRVAQSLALISKDDSEPQVLFPHIDGGVIAAIPDGAGGWYIGGSFSTVGGESRNGLAHVLDDGTVDQDFDPDVNGQVYVLILDGTTLYAGGNFTEVNGGVTRNHLASFDADTGAVTAFDPDLDGGNGVASLALDGTTLYAGGDFTSVNGGTVRNRLAAFDTGTSVATGFDPNIGGAVTSVLALILDGTTLYAGGNFTGVNGGTPRNYLAAFDTGTSLATAFDPNLDSQVMALVLDGTTLYAGGTFTAVDGGGTTRNRLAAFDTATSAATSFDPDVIGEVYVIFLDGVTLYAGGNFTTVNGGTTRNRLAAFDTTTGTATAFDPSFDTTVQVIADSGSNVLVGGEFGLVNTVQRNNLVAFDLETGEVTEFDPNLNAEANSLVLDGTILYVGGDFTDVNGGTTRNGLAAFDTGTSVATAFDPNLDASAYAIILDGTTLYAAGNFTSVNGGTVRNRLAAFDTGTSVATAFNPDADASVYAIVLDSTTLYAGGDFTSVNGGTTRNYLAAFDTGTSTATAFDPNLNSSVNALALGGSTLYAGGQFTSVNGGATDRNLAAAFDTVTSLATGFNPDLNSTAYAIALDGSTVYIGGGFNSVNSALQREGIAGFNGTTGAANGFSPQLQGTVYALLVDEDALYAGGGFQSAAETIPLANIAIFSQGAASPTPSPTPDDDDEPSGGGFIPGTTPTPSASPTPTPSATPAPLAGYIIVDDNAPVTKDRFVKLTFKHPFADDQGVTMRPVNGGQLASNDRDVVAGNTARQQETSANPTPTVAPNTPEMSSGEVRPFTPEVFGWDLCAGVKDCRPGQYNVFVQYYKAGSSPSSPTVLAGMAGDETSYIYTDDVAYVPPAAMPFPPPAPVTPTPGPSGPSGPVATPTPAPVPSATPSASVTPASSPVGLPAAGPQPSGAPIFSLESLGLSPENIAAIGEAVSVAAPIIVVLTVAPIAIALATALAAGNAVAFTMFTAQSLLTVFGLKRRPRVWGTVYDAKTKHPIAYAKVELRDQSNRVLETRYTDTEGRYGFLITPASLQQQSLQLIITPSAKSYAFPSALVTTDPDYIVYDHIYRGGQIAIRRDELVNYNIPMDPGMTPAKIGRPWSYGSNIVDSILNAGFWIGLVVLPINAFLFPSLFTIGMLALFLAANAVRLGVGFHKPYGIVRDDRVRTAVPYSLVTLNDPTGKRIAFTVSDDRGRYIMLAKPGSYLVTVHTPAQVQPQRQKTTAVTTKKGWVTGTVNV